MLSKSGKYGRPGRRFGPSSKPIGLSVIALALGLGGCAGRTMISETLDETKQTTSGIFYALPRSYLTVTVMRDDKTATLAAPGTVAPDPAHRYNLSFLPSPFAHDKLAVEVSNGLLNNDAKSDNLDQSVEIVKSVLDLAARAVTGFRQGQGTAPVKYTFTRAVDPFDPASIAAFNYGLRRAGETQLEFFVADTPSGNSLSTDIINAPPDDCKGSICFRLPVAIFPGLRLKSEKSRVVAQQVVVVPDPRFTASIDVRRAPCIQQITTLTFESGMLKKNNLDKPSEILKCLEIPAAILDSLAGDLGNALGFSEKPAANVSQTVLVAPLSAETFGFTTNSDNAPAPIINDDASPQDRANDPGERKTVPGKDLPEGSR